MRVLCTALFVAFAFFPSLRAQNNPPWQHPLMISRSGNGVQFSPPDIFQDSAGVPSVIFKNGDTLICAFQWFRQPVGGPAWDRVAVKFSYDKGLQWTTPVPIVVKNLPANFQRPFDPTLAALPDGRVRIYFSSSAGSPGMGPDSALNTYSAIGTDGIHFTFEPDARVDQALNRVIDPAVIYFKNTWHYAAPIGAPEQGCYHYLSPNGLDFSQVPNIGSDAQHNWTGNYMVNDPEELRFYGSGMTKIWFNNSTNGGVWQGYQNTNLTGGDPTVVRLGLADYLIVFVGMPYVPTVQEEPSVAGGFDISANQDGSLIFIHPLDEEQSEGSYFLYSAQGRLLRTDTFSGNATVDIKPFQDRILFMQIVCGAQTFMEKVVVKKR